MSKVRVYELAKEFGMKGPEMAKVLRKIGFENIKSHMAVLDGADQMMVVARLEAQGMLRVAEPEAQPDSKPHKSLTKDPTPRKKKSLPPPVTQKKLGEVVEEAPEEAAATATVEPEPAAAELQTVAEPEEVAESDATPETKAPPAEPVTEPVSEAPSELGPEVPDEGPTTAPPEEPHVEDGKGIARFLHKKGPHDEGQETILQNQSSHGNPGNELREHTIQPFSTQRNPGLTNVTPPRCKDYGRGRIVESLSREVMGNPA